MGEAVTDRIKWKVTVNSLTVMVGNTLYYTVVVSSQNVLY